MLSWAGDPGAAAGPLPGAGAAPAARPRPRRGLGRHRRPLLRPHRARPRRRGCWYDVLDRRRSPAFAQLDDDRLAAAVALAERIDADGDPLLRALDAQSLSWRGKPAKAPGDRAPRPPPRAGRRLRRVPVDRAGRGLPPDGRVGEGSRPTSGPTSSGSAGWWGRCSPARSSPPAGCSCSPSGVGPAPPCWPGRLPGRRAGATWLGAVPLHRVLDRGWDAGAHRRLLRVDSVRVAAATAGWPRGWLVLG